MGDREGRFGSEDARRRVVIKVGGSLLDWSLFAGRLADYLGSRRGEKILLVVGGGRVADVIRGYDGVHRLGEARAHVLALRAMELTAHVVHAIVPGLILGSTVAELTAAWEREEAVILDPRSFGELLPSDASERWPESWEWTSDSIAARLAYTLGADELRLLKSRGVGSSTSRAEAASEGVVDPWFAQASSWCPRVTIVNLRGEPPTVEYLD